MVDSDCQPSIPVVQSYRWLGERFVEEHSFRSLRCYQRTTVVAAVVAATFPLDSSKHSSLAFSAACFRSMVATVVVVVKTRLVEDYQAVASSCLVEECCPGSSIRPVAGGFPKGIRPAWESHSVNTQVAKILLEENQAAGNLAADSSAVRTSVASGLARDSRGSGHRKVRQK